VVIGGGSSATTTPPELSTNDEDDMSRCGDLVSQAAAAFGLFLRGSLTADEQMCL
jgi:hypothetical protein